MISWFIEQFAAKDKVDAAEEGVCIERYLDDKIKDIEAGSGGLILQPFWTPGITNPNASGAIIGFSDFHTRYHLYRAIIEGICLELYHGLVKMQKRSSVTVDELLPAEAAPAARSYVKLPQMCSACPYTVFRLTRRAQSAVPWSRLFHRCLR